MNVVIAFTTSIQGSTDINNNGVSNAYNKKFAIKHFPVGIVVAFIVAVHGTNNGWPGFTDDQYAALIGFGDAVAVGIDNVSVNAWQRQGTGTGFGSHGTGNGRDHVGAGFGLPPGINSGAAFATNNFVIPDRKSTRLNSSHVALSRMPSSA